MSKHLHALRSYKLRSTPVWATNQSKNLFPFFLEYILLSKIQRRWKHGYLPESLLIPYLQLLLMPRNGCQSPSQSMFSVHAFCMPVKWIVVWYFPLDTFEGRCSTDIFDQMSTKSTQGSKRIHVVCACSGRCCIVIIRCSYRHITQVSPAWDHGIWTLYRFHFITHNLVHLSIMRCLLEVLQRWC